jgi:DNA polymerase I
MKFTLTDIDYNGSIRLFGDGPGGERVVITDSEFKPFFYVKEKPGKLRTGEHEIIKVEPDEKGYKVFVNNPDSVPVISHELKEQGLTVMENDIPVTQRYLIEKGLRVLEGVDEKLSHCETKWEPRVLALDIETTNKKGVPDPDNDEILMISLWSNYGTKEVLLSKKCTEPNSKGFDSEEGMLKEFNKIIMNTKPSIMVTYNGDMFDWPFIRQRMKKYGLDRKYGYDGSSMTIIKRPNSASAKIKGLAHIDLYLFVSRILSPQLKTTTLDLNSVAEELIGQNKKEMDWEEFYKDWDKSRSKK